MRMIKANRVRAEESVEIDQPLTADRIVEIRAFAFLEIDDNAKAVEQHVLADDVESVGRLCYCGFVACTVAVDGGRPGRFGEHGWHTHRLSVAVRRRAVNRPLGHPERSRGIPLKLP